MLLTVQTAWREGADKVFKVLTILVLTWTAFRIADAVTVFLRELTEKTESKLDDQIVPLLRKGLERIIAYGVKTSRELEDSDLRNAVVWKVLPEA